MQNMSDQWDKIYKSGSETQIFFLLSIYKLKLIDHESNLQYVIRTLVRKRITFKSPVSIISLGSIEVQSIQHQLVYRPHNF